mgnify:CR=1 FL=1
MPEPFAQALLADGIRPGAGPPAPLAAPSAEASGAAGKPPASHLRSTHGWFGNRTQVPYRRRIISPVLNL